MIVRGSHHSLPCAEGQAWSVCPMHDLGSPFGAADGKHNGSKFSDWPEVTSKWQDGDPTPRPCDCKSRLPA